MSAVNRKPIFTAVKALRKGQGFTLAEVKLLDAAIDEAVGQIVTPVSINPGRRVSQRGIDLMHRFEGCELEAYKDPGSKDGLPITIGYGSTSDMDGNPIRLGTTWSQEQANAKFEQDLAKFSAKVDALIGSAPTTQHQFDAMCALAYNIGIGAFMKSTVLRKHKAGDYVGAAAAFAMWVKNDGAIMRGLVRRRAAEADLYDDPEVMP